MKAAYGGKSSLRSLRKITLCLCAFVSAKN
jgi:hypothetical protein